MSNSEMFPLWMLKPGLQACKALLHCWATELCPQLPHGNHKDPESAGGGHRGRLWRAGFRTVSLKERGQEVPLAAFS